MEDQQDASRINAGMGVGDAIKHAFIVSWKYKWFWPLGFILNPQIVGVSYYNGKPDFERLFESGEIFLWIGVIGLFAFFLSLAAALVQPTLILAVDQYRQGRSSRFKETIRAGFDSFLPCWLMGLLWLVVGIAAMIILVVPVALAFAASPVAGVLVMMPVLLVLMVGGFLLMPIIYFGYRHLVLERLGIIASIKAGYRTFLEMKGRAIGTLLATLAIIFGVNVVIGIPSGIVQISTQLGGFTDSPAYAFYLLFALGFSIVFHGYFQAFSSAVWTLVFPAFGSELETVAEVESRP